MPIYEYNCAKCGTGFEYLARNLSDTPEKCPECSSKKISKQFSSFATNSTFQIPDGCGSCSSAPACPAAASGQGCCGGH